MFLIIEKKFSNILDKTNENAKKDKILFITPEHVIYTLTCYTSFQNAYKAIGGNLEQLKKDLNKYIKKYSCHIEIEKPLISDLLTDILSNAEKYARENNDSSISLSHFLLSLITCEDCFASYYLLKNANNMDEDTFIDSIFESLNLKKPLEIEDISDSEIGQIDDMNMPFPIQMLGAQNFLTQKPKNWKEMVSCINDSVQSDSYLPLIGREEEIKDTITILLRKDKNNPVHIGEAGVGKTAIVEGLACRINNGNVPKLLKGYKIYSCNVSSILAGCSLRGEFEEKFKCILNGIAKEKAILYIDEIHTIVGAGGESASNASNMLKPYLTKGNIKIIGATTIKEYKNIERDSALDRRFSPVLIKEPTKEETLKILDGIKYGYENHHSCIYPTEILESIVFLSSKYINDKFFPDKAIDILDEAGAYIEINNCENRVVTNDIIEEIISKKCNIPKNTVSSNEINLIKNLNENIKKIVIGQDSAVDKICQSIILSRSGLRDNNKPVCNLLFVGPTGVGKTFIAQTLADSLGIPLIRKDMSEFTESHSVSKLFGSPAGYVGYDEGGMLINEIRKNPYCVLLIDEIEKAHPDVYNVFLQIMDNAKLTDSFGKSADFRNVILIMTSNAGAENAEKNVLGFNVTEQTNNDAMEKEVNRIFRPEFRNRLDAIIQFNAMSKNMAIEIATNQMKTLTEMLNNKKVKLTYTKNIIDYIVEKGYSKKYGARNIKRIIDTNIKTKLGNELLFGKLSNGGKCNLSIKDNELVLK